MISFISSHSQVTQFGVPREITDISYETVHVKTAYHENSLKNFATTLTYPKSQLFADYTFLQDKDDGKSNKPPSPAINFLLSDAEIEEDLLQILPPHKAERLRERRANLSFCEETEHRERPVTDIKVGSFYFFDEFGAGGFSCKK